MLLRISTDGRLWRSRKKRDQPKERRRKAGQNERSHREGHAGWAGSVKTFPAFLPMRPLDRIYYRGNLRLDHSFASRTELARQASDHQPMVAEFVIS